MTAEGSSMSLSAIVTETGKLLAAAERRNSDLISFRESLLGKLADAPASAASILPVCRFWSVALGQAGASVSAIGMALAAVAPRLTWTQNPNYRRSPPSPGFLDNYGYAVLAGPADGPPALARHDQLAFGVLLLGPHTHYPLHHHPAAEVYIPLNSGEWWRGDGPWREQPPGAVIHHPPDLPHATRAGAAPLLALYLWHGELATHAKLTGNSSPQRG
jgi:Dimethlysulfonioproprionate lyase